jgi:outer membrane protein assembly factor BamB
MTLPDLRKGLVVFGLALALAGCGVKNWVSNYMAGEDNNTPPAPLVKFQPTVPIKEIWSTRFGKGADELFLKLEPKVTDGNVYVAERRGRVAAFRATDGNRVWQTDTDSKIAGGPGIGDGMVLVGTSEGRVIALNEADGKELWRAQVSSEVLAAPKAADGVVIVHTGDGNVTGLDAKTGKKLWIYDRSEPLLTLRGTSPPLLYKDMAIIGLDSGRLVALEIPTGKVIWDTLIAVPRGRTDLERMVDIDAQPLLVGDTVYVVSYQGRLAAVTADTGQILWSRDISSYAGISIDDRMVYLTDSSGLVWAIDRATGASVWKQDKLTARATSAPAAVGDVVAVGGVQGYLHWMSRSDGHFVNRIQVDKTPILAPPVSADGTLYVYSSGGTLAAFRPQ